MIIEIQTCDPSTGYEMCVYPRESRRKRSSWIMWISPDGSADLYTQREESGAIQGEPIHLGPNMSRVVLDASKDEEDGETWSEEGKRLTCTLGHSL
jgi:hypothetical protein